MAGKLSKEVASIAAYDQRAQNMGKKRNISTLSSALLAFYPGFEVNPEERLPSVMPNTATLTLTPSHNLIIFPVNDL